MALGRPITTLEGLEWARKNRKAVIVPDSWAWRKPLPAAALINQQGHILLDLFNLGMFIYKKEDKKGWKIKKSLS